LRYLDNSDSIVQQTKLRRLLIIFVALSLGASTVVALKISFIHFQYSGIIGGYISRSGSTVQGGLVTLPLNLYEVVTWLVDDLVPIGFAWYYSICAIFILVVNPLLLALLAIISVTVARPCDRRFIFEGIELLQCWCGSEAIVIASLVLVPNIELITKFVFDTSDLCVKVDKYKGEECLLVSGACEIGIIALCSYCAFSLVLVRLCVNDLHASYAPPAFANIPNQHVADSRRPSAAGLIF
jgi:hypothetical protein